MRADAIKEGNVSVVPTTVVDQIRLWQQEGQRVRSDEGQCASDNRISSHAPDAWFQAIFTRTFPLMPTTIL